MVCMTTSTEEFYKNILLLVVSLLDMFFDDVEIRSFVDGADVRGSVIVAITDVESQSKYCRSTLEMWIFDPTSNARASAYHRLHGILFIKACLSNLYI